jgi:hypothetical protein
MATSSNVTNNVPAVKTIEMVYNGKVYTVPDPRFIAPSAQMMTRDKFPDYPNVTEWTANACTVCIGQCDTPATQLCYIPCCPVRIAFCMCLCACTPCRKSCKCCMLTPRNVVVPRG